MTINQATDPGTKAFSTELHKAILNGIARTLHLHFNQLDPCAVIFSEQLEPGQRNAGRTGKGIIVQAVAQMLGQPAKIDGKNFDPGYAHNLQAIKSGSRWVWFDETKDIEEILNTIYSGLTGDLVVNPKNQPSFTIPSSRMPSIVITTNSPGFGTNDSDLARRYDVPLTRWYNARHAPVDEFGRELFGPQWKEEDWQKFHLMIANICQEYLRKGYGCGKLPRCAEARSMLRRAMLAEIEPELADHFARTYLTRMRQDTPFHIVPSNDVEAFNQLHSGHYRLVLDTRRYDRELAKWLNAHGWNMKQDGFAKVDSTSERKSLLRPNNWEDTGFELPTGPAGVTVDADGNDLSA
jgi:hypothetical protein